MCCDYIFLIDEAHNLVDRGREMYSAELFREDILGLRRMIRTQRPGLAKALHKAAKQMKELEKSLIETGKAYEVLDNPGPLPITMLNVSGELEEALEDPAVQEESREKILEFYFTVRDFLNISELVDENYVVYTEKCGDGRFRLRLFCVNPGENLSRCLKKGRRLTMAGSRYVLVEFSSGDDRSYIEERIRSLVMNGFIPIIAHAERYPATRNDLDFLRDLRKMGAYIQINADTISGAEGFSAKHYAKKLMKENLIDYVGSDGHRKDRRIPEIGKCCEKMKKIMGEEYVRQVLIENPWRIIQ